MERALFRNFRSPSRTLPAWALLGEGLLAGAAGTAVMTGVQTQVAGRLPIPQGRQPRKKPAYPDEPQAREEDTTQTTARRLMEGFAHRRLASRQKAAAGYLVHFGFGAVWGAALSLVQPRPTLRQGLAFGVLVWAVSENGLLPLVRLASWPNRYPLGVHAKSLLAHLAYGAGTALALRKATTATGA